MIYYFEIHYNKNEHTNKHTTKFKNIKRNVEHDVHLPILNSDGFWGTLKPSTDNGLTWVHQYWIDSNIYFKSFYNSYYYKTSNHFIGITNTMKKVIRKDKLERILK